MRLTLKTFLLTLPVIALVLVAGGTLFVYSIEQVIETGVQRTLHFREATVLTYLKKSAGQPLRNETATNVYSISEVRSPFYNRIEKDTMMYDPVDGKQLNYRQLTFGATIGQSNYRISVRKEMVDTRMIEEVISRNMFFMFFLIGISLVIFMLLISNFLWKPFYRTLEKLRSYQLNSGDPLQLKPTTTVEFRELKTSLEAMSAKIRTEFGQLKEFTENVSHEIRTPVTIIKAQSDNLLQSEHMTEDDLRTIVSIQQATDRLARITEGLLLLVRIDRGSFDLKSEVDFGSLFRQKAKWFEDLIALKELDFNIQSDGPCVRPVNEALAEILVRNVLSNAIKYNRIKGHVKVHLHPGGFTIENTDDPEYTGDPVSFQRYRTGDAAQGHGLGISIVEKICSYEQINFHYQYQNQLHQFRFQF